MKKIILSLVLAVMAAFTLAAQDDATTQEIPIGEQTELACDKYVLVVPDGFMATSRVVGNSCNMCQRDEPFITVAPYVSWRDADSFKADVEGDGYEALDDITVGEVTYNVYYWLDEKDRNCHHVKVATPQGDESVAIHFFTGATDMEIDEAKEALMTAVQTVLNNMTIK